MLCVHARGLSKSYGGRAAVDGLDLDVEPGQVFGFLGPNGAGKSTTIKLLTTLVRPSSGSLEMFGIDAVREPLRVRSKIGVVLQQPSYEPTLSVERALDKYGMMWGVPADARRRRVEQLLSDFELGPIRKKRNEDLSIGQRRRVQVAREFMHEADLMFLDEPTVGLDPAARRRLLDFLREKTGSGLTIFYTTHVLSEAEYLCDNVAIIDHGRLAAIDTPGSLKRRFGREKTVTIRLSEPASGIAGLDKVAGCEVSGETITIRAAEPEKILAGVLSMIGAGGASVEDLSVAPADLEEAFLRMVEDNAPGN